MTVTSKRLWISNVFHEICRRCSHWYWQASFLFWNDLTKLLVLHIHCDFLFTSRAKIIGNVSSFLTRVELL